MQRPIVGEVRTANPQRPKELVGLFAVLILTLCYSAAAAEVESLRWIKFDHHTHLKSGPFFGGDGTSTLAEQQAAFSRAGYDLVVNAPHSDFGRDASATANWLRQKQHEEGCFSSGKPLRVLGEELTVERGPGYSDGRLTRFLGLPANREHLGLFGISDFIPHLTPMKAACEWTHLLGGVAILNHVGPGPGMWEPGYWDRAGLADKLDGMEAYNDRATERGMVAFDHVYRHAISYRGLALKFAALGATDNHGLKDPIGACTMALVRQSKECSLLETVVEAVRARRTIAVSSFPRLEVQCAHLGEIVRTNVAQLSLRLPMAVEQITLFRETEPSRTWTNASIAEVSLELAENTAFSWLIQDKGRHACTSGIWFEPKPKLLLDLVVTSDDISVERQTVRVVVHNRGEATARNFLVRVVEGFPFNGGQLKSDLTVGELRAGESKILEVKWGMRPKMVYVKVDAESFALDQDDDRVVESNERNNSARRNLSP